ncbi:outer membrane beta-barrel protein [Hymenobacter tenuis]
MFIRSIGIGTAFLSLPLLGVAQATEPPTPRFYVGVSAYTNWYQRASRGLDNSKWPPVQLTLGYQLRPRLGVQVSTSYTSSTHSYVGMLSELSYAPGAEYASDRRNTSLNISVLGRYTLTRDLSHRFQVDALGGFTLDHNTYHQKGYVPNFNRPGETAFFERNGQANHFGLSLGPSVRYRLFSGLEAVGEGTLNLGLQSPNVLTTSGSIGLRYRFGH